MTVAGMVEAVEIVISELEVLRSEEVFGNLLLSTEAVIVDTNLKPLNIPR